MPYSLIRSKCSLLVAMLMARSTMEVDVTLGCEESDRLGSALARELQRGTGSKFGYVVCLKTGLSGTGDVAVGISWSLEMLWEKDGVRPLTLRICGWPLFLCMADGEPEVEWDMMAGWLSDRVGGWDGGLGERCLPLQDHPLLPLPPPPWWAGSGLKMRLARGLEWDRLWVYFRL